MKSSISIVYFLTLGLIFNCSFGGGQTESFDITDESKKSISKKEKKKGEEKEITSEETMKIIVKDFESKKKKERKKTMTFGEKNMKKIVKDFESKKKKERTKERKKEIISGEALAAKTLKKIEKYEELAINDWANSYLKVDEMRKGQKGYKPFFRISELQTGKYSFSPKLSRFINDKTSSWDIDLPWDIDLLRVRTIAIQWFRQKFYTAKWHWRLLLERESKTQRKNELDALLTDKFYQHWKAKKDKLDDEMRERKLTKYELLNYVIAEMNMLERFILAERATEDLNPSAGDLHSSKSVAMDHASAGDLHSSKSVAMDHGMYYGRESKYH